MNPLISYLSLQFSIAGWFLLIMLLLILVGGLFLTAFWSTLRQKLEARREAWRAADSITPARLLAWLILILIVVAVVAVVISFLSFEARRAAVDSISFDGTAEGYTTNLDEQVARWLSIVGWSLLILGLLALWQRRRMRRGADGLLYGALKLFLRASEDLRKLFNALGGLTDDGIFLWALAIVMLWGLILRVIYINQPARFDEAISFFDYISRPVVVIISAYHAPNNHVLHSLLSHASMRAFGIELWALRIPTLLAGVLMAPAAYLLGRILYGRKAALLAAGLIASYSTLIEFSTNARGYTLMSLMVLISLALAEYIRRRINLAGWLLIILTTAFGFYSLPIMFIPFSALFLWLFLSWILGDVASDYGKSFLGYLLGLGVGVVGLTSWLYLPIFATEGVLGTYRSASVWTETVDEYFNQLLYVLDGLFKVWIRDLPPYSYLVLLLGLLLYFVFFHRIARNRIPLAVIYLPWTVIVLLIQRASPAPRILIFLLPLILLWVSAGLAYLWKVAAKRYSRLTDPIYIILAIFLSLVIGLNLMRERPDGVFVQATAGTPETALYLKENLREGDLILAPTGLNIPLRYYFLLYDVPFDSLYNPLEEQQYDRLIVVVKEAPILRVQDVLNWRRFPGDLDPESAELLTNFSTMYIYEIIP